MQIQFLEVLFYKTRSLKIAMKLNGYNYSRESLQKQLAQGHYFFVAFILNTNVI